MTPLLEVTVLQARDVPGAQEGGADRLFLEASGLSPDLTLASSVLRETDLPVRMMLRLNRSYSTTGGEFSRLVGLAQEYLALGAEGVAFGFLDDDLEIDVRTCLALAGALPNVPWTFHNAIDSHLDGRRAWRQLLQLPGLDSVRSSGSTRGLEVGLDDVLAVAGDPAVARLLLPGDGLLAEHVPWLVRAGVRQFHVGIHARPGGSLKAYVDSGIVRSFRLLVDDSVGRAG